MDGSDEERPGRPVGSSRSGARGRGRPRLTTRARVIEAVLAEGLAAFTVTGVADRLGTTHGTLYGYFGSREELAVAAVNAVVARTEWPEPKGSWRALLDDYARALWELCRETPGFAACVLALAATPVEITTVVRRYAAHLESHGFGGADALVLIDLIGEEVLLTAMLLARDDAREVEIPPLPDGSGPVSVEGPAWAVGAGWLGRKLAFILDGAAHRLLAR